MLDRSTYFLGLLPGPKPLVVLGFPSGLLTGREPCRLGLSLGLLLPLLELLFSLIIDVIFWF